MIAVPLTQGYEAFIDPDDMERVSEYKWTVTRSRNRLYATTYDKSRYVKEPRQVKQIYLHRLITNAPDGVMVDHIDGDGLNCTRDNLRLANYSQNAMNSKVRTDNTSGYRGVIWNSRRKRWTASLAVDGKRLYLGAFVKIEDAAKAYQDAALKYHGEFVTQESR